MLSVVVQGVLRVSCIIVLCLPPLLELASFASKSTRAFCSRGTCTNLNTAKVSFRIWTYCRYATIWGSLAWYSPVYYPVTNRESLFFLISLASSIPAIRASYSARLLLALKANHRAYSISNPFDPSKMTPAPLPCWLEDPSTTKST